MLPESFVRIQIPKGAAYPNMGSRCKQPLLENGRLSRKLVYSQTYNTSLHGARPCARGVVYGCSSALINVPS